MGRFITAMFGILAVVALLLVVGITAIGEWTGAADTARQTEIAKARIQADAEIKQAQLAAEAQIAAAQAHATSAQAQAIAIGVSLPTVAFAIIAGTIVIAAMAFAFLMHQTQPKKYRR